MDVTFTTPGSVETGAGIGAAAGVPCGHKRREV